MSAACGIFLHGVQRVSYLNFNWKGSAGCEATTDNNLKLLEIFHLKTSKNVCPEMLNIQSLNSYVYGV